MNKTITRLFFMLVMTLPLVLVSCDDDDDYYPPREEDYHFSGPLNQYEKALVGNYISDDKPERLVQNSLHAVRGYL